MSHIPWLSADIYHVLLDHLPQREIALVMRTSKTLHAAGIRPLLRSGVTLKSEAHLSSFCEFVLSDVAARAHHVRKLYLNYHLEESVEDFEDDDDDDEEDDGTDDDVDDEDDSAPISTSQDCLRLLVKVLENTTHIEDLGMDSCEEFLLREKGLKKAIVSLKTLKRLQLASVGIGAAAIIDQVKSPLVEIDVFCQCEDMYEDTDLIDLVKHHFATLEKLSASQVDFYTYEANIQLPKVRAFALRVFSDFTTADLCQLFPNLRYLELSRINHSDGDGLRDYNKENPGGSWDQLEHLCGDLEALYGLALSPSHPVRRLDICDLYLKQPALERLYTLISETSPTHLWLESGGRSATFDAAALLQVLAPPKASSISHLGIEVSPSTFPDKWESFLDGLVTVLSSLTLSFFILRLSDVDKDAEMHDVLQGAPLDAIAHQLAVATQKLRHISIEVVDGRTWYWSVTRADQTTVTRLEPAIGRELVHAEGLWFNDRSLGLCKDL